MCVYAIKATAEVWSKATEGGGACDWCKSATDVDYGARHESFKVCV